MDSASSLGVLLYVCGGLAGAVFYLPLKSVRSWAWESYWMIYAITALVLARIVLAAVVTPNFLSVLGAAPASVLFWCFFFGIAWGVGGLTWGIMIRYLGVGLGLAIGCGLCAAVGTLVPPLREGQIHTLFTTNSGIFTILGVLVSLLGIVAIGIAGMSKENELSEEQKKSAVTEYNFSKGLCVAIISGVMSAGMFLGIRNGDQIIKLALEQKLLDPTSPWKGFPVLVVVLLGGFIINFLYCFILNIKNRTVNDYANDRTPLKTNYLFSACAGILWYLQFFFLALGDDKIGDLRFIGASVLMSSTIVFSSIIGIALKEWHGASGKPKSFLAAGLAILIAAVFFFSYGNYLKEKEKQAQIPAP